MVKRNSTQSATGPVTVIEKAVPNPLSLDLKPELSGDLNAKGYGIKAAGDIGCKTINGLNIVQKIDDEVAFAIGQAETLYSPKNHSHPEFKELLTEISQRSHKDHTHDLPEHSHDIQKLLGTLPLDRLEDGAKVKELLTKDLCPLQHAHPNIEKAILSLDKVVASLKDAVGKKLDETVLQSFQQSLNSVEDVYRKELAELEKKIPVVPVQMKQMIGIKRVHSLHKGIVAEIVGRDEEGTPVKVTVTRSGKEIKIGDAVAVDEVFILSPASASVRIKLQ